MNGPSALSGASHQLALPRNPQDAELVVLAAFRYALGRQTYLVESIARWLRWVMPGLRPHLRELIAREIDAVERRDGLGAKCDAMEWCAVRHAARSAVGPSAQSGSTACVVKPPAQKRRGGKRRSAKPVSNC